LCRRIFPRGAWAGASGFADGNVTNLEVHAEVQEALHAGTPVVALESAVITTGVPREPLHRPPPFDAPQWDADGPTNLQLARTLPRLVRAAGAIPATVGIIDGVLWIGLDDEQLLRLAVEPETAKASVGDVSYMMSAGKTAGTTVSSTLFACGRTEPAAIRVMATGGIGGLHRGWQAHLDISADLVQIARSPVCVVCSGIKSILDVRATLEALEALGVPVIAYGADQFPLFYARGRRDIPSPRRLDHLTDIVQLCRTQWTTLGLLRGVVVANPVPAELALEPQEVERIVCAIEAEPDHPASFGRDRTPDLLKAVAQQTGGRALDANLGLLAENARLAARIAVELASG